VIPATEIWGRSWTGPSRIVCLRRKRLGPESDSKHDSYGHVTNLDVTPILDVTSILDVILNLSVTLVLDVTPILDVIPIPDLIPIRDDAPFLDIPILNTILSPDTLAGLGTDTNLGTATSRILAQSRVSTLRFPNSRPRVPRPSGTDGKRRESPSPSLRPCGDGRKREGGFAIEMKERKRDWLKMRAGDLRLHPDPGLAYRGEDRERDLVSDPRR